MRWAWLIGAVALALYLVARRRAHGRTVLALGGLAAAGAALIGLGVIELPNVEKLIEDVGARLGKWTYVFVGVMAFLETGAFVGLIAPGETTVIVGGLVAGQGQIDLFALIAIVWTAAVLGDVTSYTLGRRLGREFLVRHGSRAKITEQRLEQVEGFFERRGGVTILIGRFIGVVRALAPFIAGASRMPLRRFLPYDVLGAGAWAITFCVLGYAFWRSFDQLTTWVSRGLFAFGLAVVLIVAIAYIVRLQHSAELRRRTKAWVAAQLERPQLRPAAPYVRAFWRRVLGPLGRRAAAPVRFLWDRVTPGDLGLELTTLLALVAVGLFAFIYVGHDVVIGVRPPFDRAAFSVGRSMHSERGEDVVVWITALGSFPVVGVLVTGCALSSLMRRRYVEAGLLVLAFLLTWVAVDVAKASFDRPRPSGSHVGTVGSAYPSGHAAYGVAWLACAVTQVRALTARTVQVAAIVGGIVLMIVIALSRVYLRAHYFSDVVGGVGLGGTIFGVAGIVTVIVAHVRQNARPAP